jgi:hypothetical protein
MLIHTARNRLPLRADISYGDERAPWRAQRKAIRRRQCKYLPVVEVDDRSQQWMRPKGVRQRVLVAQPKHA